MRRMQQITISLTLLGCAFGLAAPSFANSVGISGQFSDSMGNFVTNSTIPVNGGLQMLTFTNPTTGSAINVEFGALLLGITNEGGDLRSAIVEIDYFLPAGSPFLGNQALLNFNGFNGKGSTLDIDRVINFTKAGLFSRGWILNSNLFPAPIASFHTKAGGLPGTNGAPRNSFFQLNYSFVVPEPSTYILIGTGLLSMAGMVRRKLRARANRITRPD